MSAKPKLNVGDRVPRPPVRRKWTFETEERGHNHLLAALRGEGA